jgi:hypothetical protein
MPAIRATRRAIFRLRPRGIQEGNSRRVRKNLREDADTLLQLAQELKDEAEKTEQTDMLSLVRKAEEVEKLARHMKDLAKAS